MNRTTRTATAALAALLSATTAFAGLGDCGQPFSSGSTPVASDALFTLRAAVGLEQCPRRICDTDNSGRVNSTDALRVLIAAVRKELEWLLCPAASTTSTLPPSSSTTSVPPGSLPSSTTTTLPPNLAPVIDGPDDVYRTYPALPIAIPVLAHDPDGDQLMFQAADLPTGCLVDADSGTLTWTPTVDQIGGYEFGVVVSDDGSPPGMADATVRVKVQAPDACVTSECTPAGGCSDTQLPIAEQCCDGEPAARAAEPSAGCPEGRVLFVGRNTFGFGRMQSCDLLPVTPFAQGGATVRFHVEARCVNTAAPVTIRTKLTTADESLIDHTVDVSLQQREDGYAQQIALVYALAPGIFAFGLDGVEAELDVRITDDDGASVRQRLRVTLTLDQVGDLPDPDIEDIPAGEAGCVGCHRPLNGEGQRVGIEDAHPAAPLTCIDCHGGNATATTRTEAHVSQGGGPKFLKNLTSDELDAVSPEYLRFINPGDLRAAAAACGAAGCHPEHVANVPLTTMATFAAHYSLPRYLAGMQPRGTEVAAVDAVDPDFDAETAPEGALESISALRGPPPGADRTELATAIDEYLPKSCPTCHLSAFGRNTADGTYRSSGCTACHMVYADNGVSESDDPTAGSFPPHPARHRLTTAIPTEQCAHCHFQGGRVGLAYRGIREGGFAPEQTPENTESLGVPLYGHGPDFYFTDEDTTNDHDETPPDLHHTAGMHCIDCHVGGDVHGDGYLYQSERHQVGIRCEDCHGTVRAAIAADPADGLFKNSAGFPLKRIRRNDTNGLFYLQLANEDRELYIPQVQMLLEAGLNPFMTEAMGIDEHGFSHTDSMECYACHTSWRQSCLGCHVTVDDRGQARNLTTGEVTQGSISASRDDYSIDFLALGVNSRGKITPLCASMAMFWSYIDADGNTVYDDKIRTSGDGRKGFGWNPFHHHTVSRTPVNCDSCHPNAAEVGEDNSELLSATYGFGSGLHMITDGEGTTHDVTQFLDEGGTLIADFPHADTGPVPAEKRARAMAVEAVPQPR